MLRRLGGLGAAPGGAGLRRSTRRNRGFSVRGPMSLAARGERHRPRSFFAKEVGHDYARNLYPETLPTGTLGPARARGPGAAVAAEAWPRPVRGRRAG